MDRNLAKLPTFREAILKVMSKGNSIDLLFICNNCDNVFNIHENVQLSDIKKWLNKHHPFKMRLGMTQDERDKYKQRNLHSQNVSKRILSP